MRLDAVGSKLEGSIDGRGRSLPIAAAQFRQGEESMDVRRFVGSQQDTELLRCLEGLPVVESACAIASAVRGCSG